MAGNDMKLVVMAMILIMIGEVAAVKADNRCMMKCQIKCLPRIRPLCVTECLKNCDKQPLLDVFSGCTSDCAYSVCSKFTSATKRVYGTTKFCAIPFLVTVISLPLVGNEV
ncbi:unnamed protein product [Ilex paraguariensis]|uniref:Uncharacterized protein n=1 Tax=Ilex paraguariensis TaxID=185542 RepID=A0ABC8SJR0_9AQUA